MYQRQIDLLQENDRHLKELRSRREYYNEFLIKGIISKAKQSVHRQFALHQETEAYTETFDKFCQAILATYLLNEEQRQLVQELLNRWEANKQRGS